MKNPRPVAELDAKKIKGLFFDIDDTFSSDGKITGGPFGSIWRLKDAGLVVVPVTGRPAGWCDHIARMWPVTAVVGENGAFYFMMKGGKLAKRYAADKRERDRFKNELAAIRDEVLKEVKGTATASDQAYREFDLAIDFKEDVKPLSDENVDRIVRIAKRYGATAKISSIHVNIWFGEHTKLSTTKLFAQNELGIDLDKKNSEFVFIGDSGNDEPMFEYFTNSVGVSNVMDFKDRLKTGPSFITKGRSGEGFAELADKLLSKTPLCLSSAVF